MKIRDTTLSVLRPVGGDEELESLRESIESRRRIKVPKESAIEKQLQ